jgi:hypothetical protein
MTFLNLRTRVRFSLKQLPVFKKLQLSVTWVQALTATSGFANRALFTKPLFGLMYKLYTSQIFELASKAKATNLILFGQNFRRMSWMGFGWQNLRHLPSTYAYLYFTKLIRFLEFCTGKLVNVYVERNFIVILTTQELLICTLWSKRLLFYRRLIGQNLFINESLQIIWLTLKTKDPVFFLNWVQLTLTKISFWKHRVFLRYLQYVFLILAQYYFPILAIKGVRLVVKGKISSAGNARKRKFYVSVGSTSFSTLTNRIIYHYRQVSTFTGALGLKFWICF